MVAHVFLVVFAIAVVLPPVMLVVWAVQGARRKKALKSWAASVGWSYVGRNEVLVRRWCGAPFVGRGGGTVSELMVGVFEDREAATFTYSYTTGSGESSSTSYFHVLTMSLPAPLPGVELTPEGSGGRFLKALRGQDIQFESEDFNKAWRVRADDLKFAHDVVNPRLMDRLLWPDAWGVSLRIEGGDLLCWMPGKQDLDAIWIRLSLMRAVVGFVPGFVWLDHGFDPGPVPDGAPAPGTVLPV